MCSAARPAPQYPLNIDGAPQNEIAIAIAKQKLHATARAVAGACRAAP